MAVGVVTSFHALIEILVTAVSILGGGMAFCSGLEARRSIQIGADSEHLAFRINCGLAEGFEISLPLAILTAIFLAAI